MPCSPASPTGSSACSTWKAGPRRGSRRRSDRSMATPLLTLSTARTAALDSAARQSIVDLCTEAHGEDFGPLFSYLPSEGLHALGSLGDLLISHAVVTTRWLQTEELPLLRTAYVDAMATLPAYQSQGYGSDVMSFLAQSITPDFEIACLQTGRNGFYTR